MPAPDNKLEKDPIMSEDQKPADIDLATLWSALGGKEQDQACLDIWTTQDGQSQGLQGRLIGYLSKLLRFRPATFAELPAKSKAKHLGKRINTAPFRKYHSDLIRAWLLENKRSLLVDFMEGADLPHDNGMLDEGEGPVDPPTREALRKSASGLSRHSNRDIAVYLGFLIIAGGDFWQNLPEALEESGFSIASSLDPGAALETDQLGDEDSETSMEDNESFTTLDNALIQMVVASAFGEEGALNEEQTLDLVDEVVDLNAKRHRSVFHLGFYHAVFDREFEFHFPGENQDRRLWYLCGVLFGLLRQGRSKRCLELLEEYAELAEALSTTTSVPCGAMILPHLYRPLLEAERIPLLVRWISKQMRKLSMQKLATLILDAHDDSGAMVRRGQIAEAGLILDAIDEALHKRGPSGDALLPGNVAAFLAPRNARRRAQIRQQQGNLAEAKAILEELDHQTLEPAIAASVLSDLGLIEGGFRSLPQIKPKKSPDATQALHDSLAKGRGLFEKAVTAHDQKATNAHFSLGVMEMLNQEGSPSTASDHFNQALGGMLHQESAYTAGALIDWTRFCLGLSLLERLEEENFMTAAENIRVGLAADTNFPIWMWKRVLIAASAFEDKRLAKDVAASLLEHRSGEAFNAIREAGVLGESPELREAYLNWILEQKIPLADRWDQLRGLLSQCIGDGSCELGETILDELEGLATRDRDLRLKFVDLLNDSANYSPIWEPSDAELALARFHEIEGNLADAAEIWQRRFYRLREAGELRHLEEARDIVEALKSFKLSEIDTETLHKLVEEKDEEDQSEAKAASDLLRNGGTVSILYVGGNETQAAYEDRIRRHFKEQLPGVNLQFYFPGWSSGWNYHLDKVKNSIADYDAVVLNNLVRTQFGRHMRKLCDENTPWFACTGRGRQSLQRAIEKAALWAAGRETERS